MRADQLTPEEHMAAYDAWARHGRVMAHILVRRSTARRLSKGTPPSLNAEHAWSEHVPTGAFIRIWSVLTK
jgi:hypothetical protein